MQIKIIDKETGKRVAKDEKSQTKKEPLKRNIQKEALEENSPMAPPGAYNKSVASIKPKHPLILQFIEEHKVCSEKIKAFEKHLLNFKTNGFQLDKTINQAFSTFFDFFDNNLIDHNQKEEKLLFPILHQRLIEAGEHSKGENPTTAVDMLEDDHIKFIQLCSLCFNFLGVAARLQDASSRGFVYNVAFDNGQELIELLRLHIYREEEVLFPLASKYLKNEDWELLQKKSNIK